MGSEYGRKREANDFTNLHSSTPLFQTRTTSRCIEETGQARSAFKFDANRLRVHAQCDSDKLNEIATIFRRAKWYNANVNTATGMKSIKLEDGASIRECRRHV